MAWPSGQPVRAPARGQRRVEQSEADRAGGVGLFQRRDLVRDLLAFDHRHREDALVELRAPLGDLFGIEAEQIAPPLSDLGKPCHCTLPKHDEPPGLELAVVGRPRGRLEDRAQVFVGGRG